MKLIYYFILLVCVAVIIGGCKHKELPETEIELPVFYFEGTLNGSELVLRAGDANYYMYTKYYKDDNNVITLKGKFSNNRSCTNNCSPQLIIELKDYKVRSTSTIDDITNVLKQGYINYSYGTSTIPTDSTETFSFIAEKNPAGGITTYSWDLGDGTILTGDSVVHAYTTSGIQYVCLTTTKAGFSKTSCNTIDVTKNSKCRFVFDRSYVLNAGNYQYSFSAPAAWQNHSWNLGNGSSSVPNASSSYTSTANGYRVCLTATNTSGCTTTFCRDIYVAASGYADWHYKVAYVKTYQTNLNLSKAKITYTANDKTYTSAKNTAQPSGSYFEITKTEPYKTNTQGDNTYKITARMKAWLYNTTNSLDSISIESNNCVFGVAY